MIIVVVVANAIVVVIVVAIAAITTVSTVDHCCWMTYYSAIITDIRNIIIGDSADIAAATIIAMIVRSVG